jgi:predicted RNase H-like HicB family nuclease
MAMTLTVELDRETDSRWIAEVPELPGVLAYGESREQAINAVKALALHALADRIEHGEADGASVDTVAFVTSAAA